MRIATFNIRYDNIYDKENSWEDRRNNVCNLIKSYEWDVFGLQEVLKHQLSYVQEKLSKYSYVGVGREDGIENGEFAPIFYKKDKFELLDSNTFWLSNTPNIPSKSWNSACVRICTYAKLLEKSTNKEFILMNTHFDHESEIARYESAKLITHKIKEMKKNIGIIIMGDFNSCKTERCYRTINEKFDHVRDISKEAPYGPKGTFNEFRFDVSWNELEEIDHIFVNDNIDILNVRTLTDSINEKYLSDHFPIMSDINLI
ncbi:MAG: endonuclease/exonuclease/phosphatase family protein [Peptostreptococcaceae bacterium]